MRAAAPAERTTDARMTAIGFMSDIGKVGKCVGWRKRGRGSRLGGDLQRVGSRSRGVDGSFANFLSIALDDRAPDAEARAAGDESAGRVGGLWRRRERSLDPAASKNRIPTFATGFPEASRTRVRISAPGPRRTTRSFPALSDPTETAGSRSNA